jgi:hypothetical protein
MKAFLRVTGCTMLLALLLGLSGCNSYISKEARDRFQSREGPISLIVYPFNVVTGKELQHDEGLARRLAEDLSREHLAESVPGVETVEIPVKWRRNQAKMAEQSARYFAASVKASAIDTEYALMVEILCNPDESRVGGVHIFLSDKEGNLAAGGLTNSHWKEFKLVQPHDRAGAYDVALLMIRRLLGEDE